jgi:pyridoxamine 5'-phosphate oxidase
MAPQPYPLPFSCMTNFDQSDAAAARIERLPELLPADPLPLFQAWFDDAAARDIQPNPNAMTLATIDPDGRPSARIVLCKKIDAAAGFVAFYTNYTGRKGLALGTNPMAALVMHWDALDRQIRIEGPVVQSPAEESDAYFNTRPWTSRIGAWASDQSRPIVTRHEMRERVDQTLHRFGIDPANPPAETAAMHIPRPPHWGGYRVFIERIELWSSGVGRLHDRGHWERRLERAGDHLWQPVPGSDGQWRATRLQP